MSEAANPDERVVVPIDSAIERFSRHLDAAGNTFVIVSGRYGIGKTFFLKEFFQIHGEQYHPIFISPLKYAINRSENIFELIKLDIAMELFRKGYLEPTDPKKTSDLKSLAGYARKKTLPLAKHFLKAISKLNPLTSVASVATDGVVGLMDDYAKYVKKRKVELNIESPAVQLSLFLEKMFEEKGHFGEKDIVTEAIEQFLQEQRSQDEEGKEKEWVLVVDDFDRIDPEHIFRILNVLSAHRDEEGQGFKFGFDKMILVMDFDNLKDLYLHKYGEKANFTGYIDKFYSHEVFYFKIQDTVRDFFDRQIKTQFPEDVREIFLDIITGLFDRGQMTMRQLVRAKGFEPVGEDSTFFTGWLDGKDFEILIKDVPFVQIFPLLTRIYGSFEKVENLVRSFDFAAKDRFRFENSLALASRVLLCTFLGFAFKRGESPKIQFSTLTASFEFQDPNTFSLPVERKAYFHASEKRKDLLFVIQNSSRNLSDWRGFLINNLNAIFQAMVKKEMVSKLIPSSSKR